MLEGVNFDFIKTNKFLSGKILRLDKMFSRFEHSVEKKSRREAVNRRQVCMYFISCASSHDWTLLCANDFKQGFRKIWTFGFFADLNIRL